MLKLFPWLSGRIARKREAHVAPRLRIWNATRGVELARTIDVADHGAVRRKGLLGRESLAAGEGLWITPCEAVHTFGMKFPIDLVYLDRTGCVKKVREAVQPWRFSGCLSAHSVVELGAGTIETTQTAPGDELKFSSAHAQDGDQNARF
jgi:uncharacterized membrane protein (UPF0127 family)